MRWNGLWAPNGLSASRTLLALNGAAENTGELIQAAAAKLGKAVPQLRQAGTISSGGCPMIVDLKRLFMVEAGGVVTPVPVDTM